MNRLSPPILPEHPLIIHISFSRRTHNLLHIWWTITKCFRLVVSAPWVGRASAKNTENSPREEISYGINKKMPNDVGIVASQTKLWIIGRARCECTDKCEEKKRTLEEWETESGVLYFSPNPK